MMGGSLHWTDSLELALALLERHPGVDPARLRFTELHRMVLELPGFADVPERSGERILEAIQAAWIEERQG